MDRNHAAAGLGLIDLARDELVNDGKARPRHTREYQLRDVVAWRTTSPRLVAGTAPGSVPREIRQAPCNRGRSIKPHCRGRALRAPRPESGSTTAHQSVPDAERDTRGDQHRRRLRPQQQGASMQACRSSPAACSEPYRRKPELGRRESRISSSREAASPVEPRSALRCRRADPRGDPLGQPGGDLDLRHHRPILNPLASTRWIVSLSPPKMLVPGDTSLARIESHPLRRLCRSRCSRRLGLGGEADHQARPVVMGGGNARRNVRVFDQPQDRRPLASFFSFWPASVSPASRRPRGHHRDIDRHAVRSPPALARLSAAISLTREGSAPAHRRPARCWRRARRARRRTHALLAG